MKTQRGAIMIVCLVFLSILMAITFGYSSRIAGNNAGMEREIASARALELAQGRCMLNLQQIWFDYQAHSKSCPQAGVIWLGITSDDRGIYGKRDGNDPRPAALDGRYDHAWDAFGQGEAKVICLIYGSIPEDKSYVDLSITATARVAPDVGALNRLNVSEEEKKRWMYRSVQQIVRLGFTQQSKAFDFAYFSNNYFSMSSNTPQSIRNYGNMGSNSHLIVYSGCPLIDGDIFAAGKIAGTPDGCYAYPLDSTYIYRDTLSSYRAGALLPPNQQDMLAPLNPGYTEDINGNGIFDAGEDSAFINEEGERIYPNDKLDSVAYPAGYDAKPIDKAVQAWQTPLDMPYLGDLTYPKQLAKNQDGKIEQLRKGGNPSIDEKGNPVVPTDWELVVKNVYGDTAGQNGIYSTYDEETKTVSRTEIPKALDPAPDKQQRNGNLALIGTPEQPLRITGPVVITNDLVLKGTISGQGTIYTGRNLHVVGDIVYKDPPTWKDPDKDRNFNDPNFEKFVKINQSKDLVGFAIKGSIVVGGYYRMAKKDKSPDKGMHDNSDYWNNSFEQWQSNTYEYQTDPSDEDIGYYNRDTKTFHGNYLATDGGHRYDTDDYSTKTTRCYYESSFPDTYIKSLCEDKDGNPVNPGMFSGIFYTNHLFGGRSKKFINMGSMVTRDERTVFEESFYSIYDPRSSSRSPEGSRVKIYLPSTNGYNVWLWQEIAAQEAMKI